MSTSPCPITAGSSLLVRGYRVRKGASTPIASLERLTNKHRFNDFFRAGVA